MKTTRTTVGGIGRMGKFGAWKSLASLACAAVLLAACSGESAQSLLDAAKKQMEAQDSKAAVIQLKNALQKDPKLAEARFLLGKLLLESGDAAGATIELQKAQDLDYAAEKLVPLLAKSMLMTGDAQKVIERYDKRVLQPPEAQAELQVVLANAYRVTGKPAEGQAAVTAALKASPGNIGAQLLQVRMLAAGKDIEGATAALNKVIAAAPSNSEARQIKGELLLFKGDADGALIAFKEAIERDKLNFGAHISALQIVATKNDVAAIEAQLAAFRAVAPRHPQVKFFDAAMALEKGDLKTAGEQAQLMLKQMPDYVPGLLLAGTIEFRKGAFVQAEAPFAKAFKLAPGSGKVRLMLAQTELRMGESAKAIKLLQPMVEANPPAWEATAMMAQAQLMNGDLAQAEVFFARAAKLNPKDTRSRTAVALSHVNKGQTEQGFDELKLIADADSGPIADLAMINAYLRKKNYDAALLAIAKLEKKQPQLPMAAYLRGQTELQRGSRAQARAAFEASLKIDPAYAQAALAIASMDVADGKPELARQRFEQMVTTDAKNVKASMALLQIRTREGAPKDELLALLNKTIKANPGEASPRLALIALQMEQKEFKAAAASAQDALTAMPDNPELLDSLGQAQFFAGDINQATTTYNKMVVLSGNSPLPHTRLAEIQYAQKDWAASAQSFKKAIAIKADYVPALRGLMSTEVKAGRKQEAMAVAKTLQKQRSNEALGFVLEGDLESSQQRWPEAAKAYQSAIDKQASTDIAIKLHRVLLASEKLDDAQKMADQWVKSHANDVGFVYHLGDAALAKSDFTSAQQHYEAVLRVSPENVLALNNVAWLLNRAKKPEALNMALKANKLAPNQPALMDTLAEIYATNAQLPKAIEVQQAAVAAGPDIALHRLHLAKYYVEADKKPDAKKELERLAALGDKFGGQAEVKAMLAKL